MRSSLRCEVLADHHKTRNLGDGIATASRKPGHSLEAGDEGRHELVGLGLEAQKVRRRVVERVAVGRVRERDCAVRVERRHRAGVRLDKRVTARAENARRGMTRTTVTHCVLKRRGTGAAGTAPSLLLSRSRSSIETSRRGIGPGRVEQALLLPLCHGLCGLGAGCHNGRVGRRARDHVTASLTLLLQLIAAT